MPCPNGQARRSGLVTYHAAMRDKTATNTAELAAGTAAVVKMPQPHGGALYVGGVVGNRGGQPGRSGRPPSLLRKKLVGTFANRLHVIRDIADGRPMVRTRVQLTDVLPHLRGMLHCASCGTDAWVVATDDGEGVSVEIEAVGSATPRERMMALDLAGRYGLGAAKDVNVESVRDRMRQTLELIRAMCPPELAAEIITAIRPIWL